MILRLTTVHENTPRVGARASCPPYPRRRALEGVAGRMPALRFSWRGISAVHSAKTHVIPAKLVLCESEEAGIQLAHED
jgi:hypothetical protein